MKLYGSSKLPQLLENKVHYTVVCRSHTMLFDVYDIYNLL